MLSIMKKSNNELCQEIDGEANKEEGESIRRESDNVTENKDKENKELKRLKYRYGWRCTSQGGRREQGVQ